MLSLPAPEDTRIQHIQQMHSALLFRPRILMLLCYIDVVGLAIVHRFLSLLDLSAAKLLEQMLARTQSKRHDTDRGGFIRAVEKDAGVAGIQIRHIVSLPESVGDEFLRVMPHAASAGVVEAPTGNIR